MNPMQTFLEKLLDESTPAGQVEVVIQFKLPLPPVSGAFRRVNEIPGMYELLALGQKGQGGTPITISSFFEANQVSHVMVIHESTIQRPSNSGILIPS